MTTLALVCLSVGLGQSFLFTVAVIAAVASWIGGLEAIAAVGLLFLLNPAVVLATAMATRRIDEGEKT